MDGRADLHLHTTYSDGVYPTRTVLGRAREAGLSVVSIVDHDHVGAVDEALAVGTTLGLGVIPGVELSASLDDEDIHILGYFINHADSTLQDYLALFRAERLKRAERIVGKLNGLNIPLTLDAVLDRAGEGAVGRPHIAHALLEEGLTGSYHEAFWRYLGYGKPAYERKYHISPHEAIEIIARAGGLSFIAHPGTAMDEKVLLKIIKEGVDGIEAVHPSHSPELVAHYSGIANEYFLLTSGGSDFHGGKRNDEDTLGQYYISSDHIEMMRRRLR